jgi:hypothetical protein
MVSQTREMKPRGARFAITTSFTGQILGDKRMSAAAPSTAHLYILRILRILYRTFAHGETAVTEPINRRHSALD